MFDFLKPNQHDLYPAPCYYLLLAGGVQDNCLLSNEISRRLFYRILFMYEGQIFSRLLVLPLYQKYFAPGLNIIL